MKINYCLCGCGNQIIFKKHHRKYGIPKYISGHNSKVKLSGCAKLSKYENFSKGKNNPMFGKMHPNKGKKIPKISEKLKGKKQTKEHIEKRQESRKGWKHTEEAKKQQSKFIRKYFREHPEKHPNRNMNKISIPQRKLYDYLKQYYFVNIELEYPIKGKFQTYYLDIAIPSLKVNFEYDGEYWHRETKYSDEARDNELNKLGWLVIRINKNNVSQIDFIMGKLIKFLKMNNV